MECLKAVKAAINFEVNSVLNVGRLTVLEKQMLCFSTEDIQHGCIRQASPQQLVCFYS